MLDASTRYVNQTHKAIAVVSKHSTMPSRCNMPKVYLYTNRRAFFLYLNKLDIPGILSYTS